MYVLRVIVASAVVVVSFLVVMYVSFESLMKDLYPKWMYLSDYIRRRKEK